MSKEELRKIFIKTEDCQFCGSQRCDCSEEWMEGCKAFKEFCKKYEEDNINLELHKIKQKNKENPQLNNESIKHMLKTVNKYMNYSKWKDAYEIVFVKEIKQC